MKAIYTIILSLILGLTSVCGYAQSNDYKSKMNQKRVEPETGREQRLSDTASFRVVDLPAATGGNRQPEQVQPQARKYASMPDPNIDAYLKQLIRQAEKKDSILRICTEIQQVTDLPRW